MFAPKPNADIVVPIAAVTLLPSPCKDKFIIDPSQQTAHLQSSKILQDLTILSTHLISEQQVDLSTLINSFPKLFHDVPTRTMSIQHDIDVAGAAKPIKQHAYRVNPTKQLIMSKEVTYLIEHGLAKPRYSPWSSPCILVPKPDVSFRFCTDYRKVNSVTFPDAYPMCRMDDCVDSIGAAKFVSKLDLLKGYWQIQLTPCASEISAFVTPDAFIQYSVMAIGMRNAPATF